MTEVPAAPELGPARQIAETIRVIVVTGIVYGAVVGGTPKWLAIGLFVALPAVFGTVVGPVFDAVGATGSWTATGRRRWLIPVVGVACFPPTIIAVLVIAVVVALVTGIGEAVEVSELRATAPACSAERTMGVRDDVQDPGTVSKARRSVQRFAVPMSETWTAIVAPVTSSEIAPKSTATGTTKDLLRTAGLAIVGAGVLNTIVGLVADASGVGMAVKGFGADVREAIPVFAYFVSTIFGGIVGIVLAFIMRRSGAAKKTFYVVTGVLTAISLIGPLTADATTGTKVILEITHVLAAAIIIPALAKSLRAG